MKNSYSSGTLVAMLVYPIIFLRCCVNNKFYVTTPIYYLTAKPHLGSLYSTVLANIAALVATACKSKKFFSNRTDVSTAKGCYCGTSCRQRSSKRLSIVLFLLTKMLGNSMISRIPNLSGRPTLSTLRAVQHWLKAMYEKGDIYQGAYEGYYCVPCETFVLEKDAPSTKIRDCALDTTVLQELRSVPHVHVQLRGSQSQPTFLNCLTYQDKLLKFYEESWIGNAS